MPTVMVHKKANELLFGKLCLPLPASSTGCRTPLPFLHSRPIYLPFFQHVTSFWRWRQKILRDVGILPQNHNRKISTRLRTNKFCGSGPAVDLSNYKLEHKLKILTSNFAIY